MSYEEFKASLKQTNSLPKDFHLSLIEYTKDILLDISLRNQNRVAYDLNITNVKFSHILPMLKEIYNSKQGA